MTKACEQELLPCPNPWCEVNEPHLWSGVSGRYRAQCACQIDGPWRDTEAEAITAWNTRAPNTREDALEEAREALAHGFAEPVCAQCGGMIGDLAPGRDPEELCDTCYEDVTALRSPSPTREAVLERADDLADVVERLCDAIERQQNNIGGETVASALLALGPAYDSFRAERRALSPNPEPIVGQSGEEG